MNLKLKQLYLSSVKDEVHSDEEYALAEPDPRPDPLSELGVLGALAVLVLVATILWLLIVPMIAQASAGA